jgi:hypothetical protein
MAKSLLDRLSAEDYALIKERVYYDPSSPTGLRWRDIARPIRGRQAPRDGVAGSGKTLFVESNTYPCAAVVMLLNDIWPEDDQNVVTRKDPSGPWSDAANLQWAKQGDSRRRNAELERMALVRSILGHEGPDLGDRLRLNTPCRHGHLWNGHQLGLQRKWGKSWKCNECARNRQNTEAKKSRQKDWYQENLEDQQRKGRERMAKLRQDPEYRQIASKRSAQCNMRRRLTVGRVSRTGLVFPPNLLGHSLQSKDLQVFVDAGWDLSAMVPATVSESQKLWFYLKDLEPSPTVAKLVEAEQLQYWDQNPDEKREYCRQQAKQRYSFRYKCDPLFRLHECQRNSEKKARNRGNHTVKISKVDMDARYAEFDNRCAFCDSPDRMTIEHVVSRSKGGPHAIGNIIPTCHRCNMSKRDSEVEAWYRSQPFFSELRWRKICRVLGWQRSSVGQLALL